MAVDVVLGLQRGDEGKGRIVDLMAGHYDIVARFNGGPNAGHTIYRNGHLPLKLHQLPSGVIYPEVTSLIGNGVYVDGPKLIEEIKAAKPAHLLVSDIAHLILPHHIQLDEVREAGKKGQGSTKSGIAFVARDKYAREGVRTEMIRDNPKKLYDIAREGLVLANNLRKKIGLDRFNAKEEATGWLDATLELRPYLTDTVDFMHSALRNGKAVLAEGAQAFWLDIEHGMYPMVTSSDTTTAGVLKDLGIGPQHIERIIGVAKALPSHVGGRPFVTEIKDPVVADRVRGKRGDVDAEYGATTGRARDVGYFDAVAVRKAIQVNGVKEVVLTKLDAVPDQGEVALIADYYTYYPPKREEDGALMAPEPLRYDYAPSSAAMLGRCKPHYIARPTWTGDISAFRTFSELPPEAQAYVNKVEDLVCAPITTLGVGPERDQAIFRNALGH